MPKYRMRGHWLPLSARRSFEKYFVSQGASENSTIDQTLDLGWKLLSLLPMEELDRVDNAILKKHYVQNAMKDLQEGKI